MQDKNLKKDIEVMADFFQRLNEKAGSLETHQTSMQGIYTKRH